jgi:hypothetical protein
MIWPLSTSRRLLSRSLPPAAVACPWKRAEASTAVRREYEREEERKRRERDAGVACKGLRS